MIRCLAVDDEPLALDLLENSISKIPYLSLVAKCGNAFQALEKLHQERIDLVFLDIQMPRLTGIQLLNGLQVAMPMVILVTAYEQFAIEGYRLNVLDYLVKPVGFERFMQACEKAKSLFNLKNHTNIGQNIPLTEGGDFFFVNADYSLVKIVVAEILYIEGMKDYVKIHLQGQPKPVITRMSLKSLEENLVENLKAKNFLRVHKSFLVNTLCIQSIKNGQIFIDKNAIPYSDNAKEDLMKMLKINL